jgi:exosortase/archaeosortase family protein
MINLHYFPVHDFYSRVILEMEGIVSKQSCWVITSVLQIPSSLANQTIKLSNSWGITIGEGCTGLKQTIQALLLFLIYPGLWKHKAWFIPLSVIIIHLTNISRIVLLAIAMNLNFPSISFIHGTILRFLFYGVIFALWYIWENKIRTQPSTLPTSSGSSPTTPGAQT